ncbi:hypothetical protein [Microvirga calopogonii]|uniref:hypothetical protein n=1 Tax=Microvirga calopogonii TaxID=2078013 RepID=UPI0013B43306|nr:hypothetical protein [Microvirga calopogonii]
MPRTVSTRLRLAQEDHAACYPDDLLPDLQRTLAALVAAEIRYEEARERLAHEPPAVRSLFLVEIEARYRRERQPYLERLEHLQQRIRAWLMPGF